MVYLIRIVEVIVDSLTYFHKLLNHIDFYFTHYHYEQYIDCANASYIESWLKVQSRGHEVF